MPFFNLELLTLGLLLMTAVLRSSPQEAAVPRFDPLQALIDDAMNTSPNIAREDHPRRAVELRVVKLPRFFGPATVLHEWREGVRS